MTITMYGNKSPTNYVRKTLQYINTVSGVLRQDTSIVDPVITIQFQTNSNPPYDCNYIYIQSFGRYYFVRDWVQKSRDFWEVHLHVDVLCSFWSKGLSESPCILARSSNSKQYDLPDDQMLFTADTIYSIQKFPSTPFSGVPSRPYILTIGGVG